MDFLSLVNSVVNAEISIPDCISAVMILFNYVFSDPNIVTVNEFIRLSISVVEPYLPFIYIGLSLLLVFLGKRMFALPRFLAFLWLGFLLGTYYLSPLVLSVLPDMPAWIIGVVVGIIAAVLSKFIYFVAYAAVVAYPVYQLSFSLFLVDVLTPEGGRYWVALAIALVVVVIFFLLRKFIEMLGTAALGGFFIAESIRMLWDYTTLDFLNGIEWVGTLAITVVIALIGFIVQVKTRERY